MNTYRFNIIVFLIIIRNSIIIQLDLFKYRYSNYSVIKQNCKHANVHNIFNLTKLWEVPAHSLIISLLCCPVKLELRP